MRYGVPYKGSKNQIAPWVLSVLPSAENFYDVFAGGCAVTHCALTKGKYKHYYANDIGDAPALFYAAASGLYAEENRWISREDFARLKDSDPYIRYCWSFGNNGRDYLYAKEVEPWKKALHFARVLNDFSFLEAFGINTDKADNITVIKNADEWKKKYIEWAIKYFKFTKDEIEKYRQYKKEGVFDNLIHGSVGLGQLKTRLKSLESLQRLQSLERLERLQRLQISRLSYDEIEIKPNSVIYCDPPYYNTNGYGEEEFDHRRFWDWCEKQEEPCFISEYWMPEDRFEAVASVTKRVLLCSGSGRVKEEKIFVPKRQIKRVRGMIERKYTQLMFDF